VLCLPINIDSMCMSHAVSVFGILGIETKIINLYNHIYISKKRQLCSFTPFVHHRVQTVLVRSQHGFELLARDALTPHDLLQVMTTVHVRNKSVRANKT
jgi:hypothetical protein